MLIEPVFDVEAATTSEVRILFTLADIDNLWVLQFSLKLPLWLTTHNSVRADPNREAQIPNIHNQR